MCLVCGPQKSILLGKIRIRELIGRFSAHIANLLVFYSGCYICLGWPFGLFSKRIRDPSRHWQWIMPFRLFYHFWASVV